LLAAQELLSAPLRLLVVEGFRPLSLQVRYFTDYAEQLRRRWPDWSAEHVHRQASRSLSPPEVAPHVCGAAVDLTLCDGDQVELDLGTEVNAAPEECDEACYTAAPNIGPTARRHRQLLGHALNSVGLVNYPTEWWHWSFGDRYWVLGTGAAAAVYGPVQGPVRGPDD
jgi:D-alanyl-D-alanine dipeptidase